jgi:hypothetical protein
MHSLVQLATRKWLKAEGQLERWKGQFIKNLCEELPTGKYENWARCQLLFPHVRGATEQEPKEQESLRDWASIMYKAAWYTLEVGNGAEAEELSAKAMEARTRLLGHNHEDSLASKAMVGSVYIFQGRWEAAEEL